VKYDFICYKRCTTCGRARKWLEEHGIDYVWRDIDLKNPDKEELGGWAKLSGLPVKKLFNTSGIKYRELGLSVKLKDMSDDEMLSLLSSDGMLVKRPVLIGGGKALFGFREHKWAIELDKDIETGTQDLIPE
jgi:arsenate reductase